MRARILHAAVVLALALGLRAACTPAPDYTARFIGYKDLPDGTRVAVVAPVEQQDDEQTAYTTIPDLEPGELVFIRYSGKSWDVPQSAPEREIVSRASGK